MLRLEDEYGLISAGPAFWLARTFSRGHFVDKAQHLDRRISASLLDICSSSSAHAYVIDRKHAPIGLSAVPGAAKALTWYLGPTRVAARGKMRSSGSVRSRIRHLQRLPATPARAGPLRTERVFRKRVQSVQIPRRNAAHPVSLALVTIIKTKKKKSRPHFRPERRGSTYACMRTTLTRSTGTATS